MTITIAVAKNPATEVTLEWEKYGTFYARVYENWGGEWHKTHESRPYKLEEDARRSYRRFVRRYF